MIIGVLGGYGSLVEAVRSQRSIDVLAGITLCEVEVPSALVGHTLSEIDLRRRFQFGSIYPLRSG